MPNPTQPLHDKLLALHAKATPELFAAKPHRIAQMLRDGAHAQVPKADNIDSVDWESDAALILEAVNAVPSLLAELTRNTAIAAQLEGLVRKLDGYMMGALDSRVSAAGWQGIVQSWRDAIDQALATYRESVGSVASGSASFTRQAHD